MSELLYQTHARVHLANIRDNLLGVKKQVGPKCKVLVAVKANAYGHGAVEVSRMAERIGMDWLGVATVPEGIELRRAGLKLPILKFSPAFPEEMTAAVENDLTLSVCEENNIRELERVAAFLKRTINVHIKIDTGMGRIGCSMTDAPKLAALIQTFCPHLKIEGVFTHFPVSDEPARNDFTRNQIVLFKQTAAEIERTIGTKIPIVHCANSGGILGHPESYFDMVRPGIMTYGFYPDRTTPHTVALKPGLSLLTKISFVKKVERGTPISYGGTWKATESTWVGTIPIGYADGFNRLLTNRGRALVGGRSVPIIGRVCMDQCLINLGSVADFQIAPAKVGDTVTLIGRDGNECITVDELAHELKTITYEVTCRIDARVSRVFESE